MASVDIRQYISPWPFTVDETQGLSTTTHAAADKQCYLTSDNLNKLTDDEASLWWYAFCGGEEEEVGKVLYNRCSRITNKGYNMETREQVLRQSCIERNTQILISQVGTLLYIVCLF